MIFRCSHNISLILISSALLVPFLICIGDVFIFNDVFFIKWTKMKEKFIQNWKKKLTSCLEKHEEKIKFKITNAKQRQPAHTMTHNSRLNPLDLKGLKNAKRRRLTGDLHRELNFVFERPLRGRRRSQRLTPVNHPKRRKCNSSERTFSNKLSNKCSFVSFLFYV